MEVKEAGGGREGREGGWREKKEAGGEREGDWRRGRVGEGARGLER